MCIRDRYGTDSGKMGHIREVGAAADLQPDAPGEELSGLAGTAALVRRAAGKKPRIFLPVPEYGPYGGRRDPSGYFSG